MPSIQPHIAIEIEPFEPTWNMRNPHTQTILGAMLRGQAGITFRRERFELPDGDFVDLDFVDVDGYTWETLGDGKPIVIMLHGLEGNARSGPACGIYRYLAERGVRCVGMNLRSCSGVINRTAQLYHAGATGDLGLVHQELRRRFPDVPMGIVAISLGANILLKYLGENGEAMRGKLSAAVAISPPFDLLAGAAIMERGWGLFYTTRMLPSLQQKIKDLEPVIGDKVDVSSVMKMRTFRQFDDHFTAPIHGFADAHEYYTSMSSQNFLADIAVPTLLLRAEDDPFFDPNDIPYDLVDAHPHLYAGFVANGGHVGFIEGAMIGQYTYWAERQAARFLALMV